jgi:hypothetical protein
MEVDKPIEKMDVDDVDPAASTSSNQKMNPIIVSNPSI